MIQVLAGKIDWVLFATALVITLLGFVTLFPNSPEVPDILYKQAFIITLSCLAFFAAAYSVSFFRTLLQTGDALFFLYLASIAALVAVLFTDPINGSRSWFNVGSFLIQPVDFVKVVLVAVCARYFARRHIYIRHVRHIIISGLLFIIPAVLVFAQPDLGSAVVLGIIWIFSILFFGVSSKHFLGVISLVVLFGFISWTGFLAQYQKDRILSFVEPLADLQGVGYNAYQAKVAIGSGGLFGKGISGGTQSKLSFLPEYSSDFIFAAFAEEWGFVGVVLLLLLLVTLFTRLLTLSYRAPTNRDSFFIAGVLFWFFTHAFLHIGVNVGLLPVTGITMVFMSQGGSHLLASFIALGIVSGMSRDWLTARPPKRPRPHFVF